jgi:hypothetical protein
MCQHWLLERKDLAKHPCAHLRIGSVDFTPGPYGLAQMFPTTHTLTRRLACGVPRWARPTASS